MTYVVTFEDYKGNYESYTVNASCVEIAVMDANEKAYERKGSGYCDSDVLSVIRV